MELVFLKIDKIFSKKTVKSIEIPIGGARLSFREMEIANDEPLVLKIDSNNNFLDVNRKIACRVFLDQEVESFQTEWLLMSLVTNESFEQEFNRKLELQLMSGNELCNKKLEAV